MNFWRANKIFFCSIIFTFSFVGYGQGFGTKAPPESINTDPLTVERVNINPDPIEVGGVSELKISMSLPAEFKAYLDQFQVVIETPTNVFISEFQVTPVIDFKDPVSQKIKKGTAGDFELVTVIQLPSNFKIGKSRVNAILTYQACTKDFCLFPTQKPFSFDMKVAGQTKLGFVEQNLQKGWLAAILIVFFSGILTSFTPCIFPLIPITLAVIGSTNAGGSKLRGFSVSLSYVIGIAATYAVLGLLAAKTGALFGSFLGHPVVVGGIALVFILMGLSMFGLFETKIPDRWTTFLLGKQHSKGYVGAFLSGLIAGVIASPCVGPVLVSLLAFVAQSQNTFQGSILLFIFALGLGQIFLVLGTFSQLIYKLPRSGPWLEDVKTVFGLIMIASAFYFLYPVTPPGVFEGLAAAVLVLLGVFFGAFENSNLLDHTTPFSKTFMRLMIVLGVMFGVATILPKEWRPFSANGSVMPQYKNPTWYPYSEAVLEKARSEGKPVVIDFKAEWCLACKELEMKTFSDERVLELDKDIMWLAFDATHSSPELDELKRKYKIPGLPMVVFYDSKGKHRPDLTLTGFENADAFLGRLNSIIGP